MRKERFLLEEKEEDILPEVKTELSLDVDNNELVDISAEEEQFHIDSVNAGLSNVLSALIKDEWEAYEGYKSAIETFKVEGVNTEVINVLDEILAEELVHIGQLQKALELVEPAATEIPEGEKEAELQLQGEEGHVEESITEAPDLDGDETPDEIAKDADKRRLGWHAKKLKKYGDLMFYFNNYRFLDAMASKPTLEERKKYIIDFINRDLPSYRNSNSKTGERSLWYAGPEYTGKYGEFNGKPIDQEVLDKFADFVLDYYKEYPDFKRNLRESLKNGKKLNEELYGNWNKNETRDGVSLNLLDYIIEEVDYLVNNYYSDSEDDLDDEQLALYNFWGEADDSDKREYVLRMCDCSYISPLLRRIQDRIFYMLGENDNYLVNKSVIDDIRMDAENRLQPIEIEESLKEDVYINDSDVENGYTIDIATTIENYLDYKSEYVDDEEEEEVAFFELWEQLDFADRMKYCNWASNQVELGDYTWQCIDEDVQDQIEINLEVLEKISGNDSSNLQPIEIEESAESMLKLRESNSGDYTIDVLREVDYRLREWLIPELEETPESDLSEVEAFFLNTTDEVLDEVCKEVAYRVREDEGIWQEIGESIDYYLTHYISIEGLKEIENKFVHLEPIEIEEGK